MANLWNDVPPMAHAHAIRSRTARPADPTGTSARGGEDSYAMLP